MKEPSREFGASGARLLAWIVGFGVLAFAVGYLLVALLFFPSRDRDGIATVPDLSGQTLESARRTAERHGLELERGSALVHPRVPAGAVLAQSPLPGQETSPGTPIRVTLSAGRDRRPVPAVSAFAGEQALSLLRRTGFRVQVRRVPSERAPGTVLGTRPEAGAVLPLPATVQLTLSAGPPRRVVPNLAGMTEDAAHAALRDAGLRLGSVEYDPGSPQPLGGIDSQRPAAGDSLRSGGAVSVTLSGSAPAPVLLPDLSPSGLVPAPRLPPPDPEEVP